jgi:hypothetical protein
VLIIVLLLISFSLVIFRDLCERDNYEALKEYRRSEGIPYRNSEGKIVNSVW